MDVVLGGLELELTAEQTAVDLALSMLEIEAVDGAVEVRRLAIFDGRSTQRGGKLPEGFEHGGFPFLASGTA